jgi:hypothetical protein
MPKSTVTCNSILALLYNATPWASVADNAAAAPVAVVQVALATASYAVGSNLSSNETAYTNYVRQTVPRTVAGWTAPVGRQITNVVAVDYPQCGATGATITSAAVGRGAGTGDIWHYGDLNSPIVVSNQIQPRFAPGAITITEA